MTTTTTRSIYALARLAECADPDTDTSAGATFLRDVEGDALELIDTHPGMTVEEIDDDGSLHEAADGAVPVYTHPLWATFVDLAAYQEDLDDLGGASSDMTRNAGMALYMIASRLLRALIDEAAEEDEDEDEDES